MIEVALYRQRSSTLFINNSLSAMVTNGNVVIKEPAIPEEQLALLNVVSAIKQRRAPCST